MIRNHIICRKQFLAEVGKFSFVIISQWLLLMSMFPGLRGHININEMYKTWDNITIFAIQKVIQLYEQLYSSIRKYLLPVPLFTLTDCKLKNTVYLWLWNRTFLFLYYFLLLFLRIHLSSHSFDVLVKTYA